MAHSLWTADDLLPRQPMKVLGVPPQEPGKKTFTRTKVIATRDMAARELCLLPVVRGIEAVVIASQIKAGAIPVEVDLTGDKVVELAVLPMARYGEEDRFMPPFWCVARGNYEDANMEMETLDLDSITSIMPEDKERAAVRSADNGTS